VADKDLCDWNNKKNGTGRKEETGKSPDRYLLDQQPRIHSSVPITPNMPSGSRLTRAFIFTSPFLFFIFTYKIGTLSFRSSPNVQNHVRHVSTAYAHIVTIPHVWCGLSASCILFVSCVFVGFIHLTGSHVCSVRQTNYTAPYESRVWWNHGKGFYGTFRTQQSPTLPRMAVLI
jgi:hypothetical protein